MVNIRWNNDVISTDVFKMAVECPYLYGALMSVSILPIETQVLRPPMGGKWISKSSKLIGDKITVDMTD